MAKSKEKREETTDFIRIQHAVVIQSGNDIRALNDLLSVGWKAAHMATMANGVLVILENFGKQSTIEEMRAALGYGSDEE